MEILKLYTHSCIHNTTTQNIVNAIISQIKINLKKTLNLLEFEYYTFFVSASMSYTTDIKNVVLCYYSNAASWIL